VNAATPFGLLPLRGAEQLAAANAMDRKLLDSLISAGFELSQGPNGQGVLGLIYGQNATGYYFNAGASELIVDGTIKLRRGNVTGFTSTGVALADGSTIDADLVIFATGYRGPTSATARSSELMLPTTWGSSPRSVRIMSSGGSGDARGWTDCGS
jgi:putative flavoprotein involved in K+ transport